MGGFAKDGRVRFRSFDFDVGIRFLSRSVFSFWALGSFVSLGYLGVYTLAPSSTLLCFDTIVPPFSSSDLCSSSTEAASTRLLSNPLLSIGSSVSRTHQPLSDIIDSHKSSQAKTQSNKERNTEKTHRLPGSLQKATNRTPTLSLLPSTRLSTSTPPRSHALFPTGRLLPSNSRGPGPPPLNGSRGSFPSRGRLRLSSSVVSSVRSASSVVVSIPAMDEAK